MRPASRTNLSFHSSSDYSAQPIYLDESMSVLSATTTGNTGGGGSGSRNNGSTTAYGGSEAFHTARSAPASSRGAPSPRTARPAVVVVTGGGGGGSSGTMPPAVSYTSSAAAAATPSGGGGGRRSSLPTVAPLMSSRLTLASSTLTAGSSSPPPGRGRGRDAPTVPAFRMASPHPTPVPSRQVTGAHTSGGGAVLPAAGSSAGESLAWAEGNYPTELPPPMRPLPPAALSRRAKTFTNTAATASGSGSAIAGGGGGGGATEGSAAAGVGFWGGALQALRNGTDHASRYLDTWIDPDAANAAAAAGDRHRRRDGSHNTNIHGNTMNRNSAATNTGTGGGAGGASGRTVSDGFGSLFDDVDAHSPYHDNPDNRAAAGAAAGNSWSGADGRSSSTSSVTSITTGTISSGGRRPRYGILVKPIPSGSRAARVYVPRPSEPFGLLPPMARPVPEVTEEEQLLDEATDVDAEPPTVEVDLVSALRGYRDNPNEAYGHLVAAALTSRSQKRPVTGLEIAEAGHHPFLVRLIVNSGCLDCEDPVAQENVQETLNLLLPEDQMEVTPALFEYLESFFQMKFVKLSHAQYTLLKACGFENISLMYAHRHVLPDERFHSILINYSGCFSVVNLIFTIAGLLANTTCTVAMGVVLSKWMTVGDSTYQSYGFYTIIAYGIGYALHLIFMVFFMRAKDDERVYEDTQGLTMPSAYTNVCPILPIFEVMCLRNYISGRRRGLLAYTHNVLVASRLADVCYAFCYGFPQYIVQSYLNHTSRAIAPEFQRRWDFYFLMVAVIVQWSIALVRFSWMMVAYDSTSGMGFARFNMRRVRSIVERHTGIPKILYYLFVYVLECGVYIIVAASAEFGHVDDCVFLPTTIISLSGVVLLIILVVYILIIFHERTLARISFVSIPVCLIMVATLVLGTVPFYPSCADFDTIVFKHSFIFGYIVYAAYFLSFAFWLLEMMLVIIAKCCGTTCFPRLSRPLMRPEQRIRKKGDDDESGGGGGGDAADVVVMGGGSGAGAVGAVAGSSQGGGSGGNASDGYDETSTAVTR